MIPSLYRDIEKPSSKPKKDNEHKKILESLTPPHNKTIEEFLDVDSEYIEPLLQHYGVQTSWLDVVDNIWIALWFACHRCIKKKEHKPLVSFLQRHPDCHENANMKKEKKKVYESYCFIPLISVPLSLSGKTDETDKKHHAGHYLSKKVEVIDLRYCIPSYYLRPHTQHGLVMRKKSKSGATSMNFDDFVEGIIRIDLLNALDWIKDDRILTTRNLFPPPHIDAGLSLLLEIPQLRPHLDLPMA